MGIKVSCPHCDQTYTLAETQEGKTVRCKHCGESFVVSRGRPRRREQEEEEVDDRPRRRSASRSSEDEEEDDRPRRRKTKGGMIPLWAWLAGGGGLLLLLILVVVVVANKGSKGDKGGSSTTGGNGGKSGYATVSHESFRRLRVGMTLAELRAIFGPPSADWTGNEQDAPAWTNGPSPTLVLSVFMKAGKLEHAELIALTRIGDKTASDLVGLLDSKGFRSKAP